MTHIVESVRPPWEEDQAISVTAGGFPTNTSVVARDVETGEELWSWFHPEGTQRSALVTTSDIVFSGFRDGFIRFFNSETGELLREMNNGNPMSAGLTTGQDSTGDQKIFAILSTAGTPGTLIAIGLNERAQAVAQTVTVTQTTRTTVTTTSATTITQTSVSTTTATSTTTMTTTSATTVTSTLAAQTITQTSTAEAQTTTVTSEVTEEVGLSSTITYAAVAVAVIAIIGAAVLYTRKE
jgi:hypothetical protein